MKTAASGLALLLVASALPAAGAAPASAAPSAAEPDSALLAGWRGVVAHSPEYAAAEARRDAGRASKEIARALWMPTVAAQGGVARRTQESSITGAEFSAPGFGTSSGVDFRTSVNGGDARQWAVIASQPLLGAARSADANAARARSRMGEAQYRQTVQSLMLRTGESLAAVVGADARLQAARRQHEAVVRARELAQARYESGDLPITDWREAEAQADALAVAELDAEQALAVAGESWTNLTGLPPPATRAAEAAPAVASAAADDTLADWLARAQRSSPALQIQQEQLALAEAEARRWSRIDGLQLELTGELGRETLSGRGDFGAGGSSGGAGSSGRLASIGIQASLPLFTGGMRAAERHAAAAGQRAAESDLAAATKAVELGTRTAWLAARTAEARQRAQQRSRQSAESRLDATRIGYETGDRTLLEWLSAQGAALQSGADAREADCALMLASLRLQAAAGTLDEQALQSAGVSASGCAGGIQQ